jgi:hypothetical protein
MRGGGGREQFERTLSPCVWVGRGLVDENRGGNKKKKKKLQKEKKTNSPFPLLLHIQKKVSQTDQWSWK